MIDIIAKLQGKDEKQACDFMKEIGLASSESNVYFHLFDDFLGLLSSKNSFVRTRGFILCCQQAKWDETGKIKESLPQLLPMLHDEKPTAVRQCLTALRDMIEHRPELGHQIQEELNKIDLSKYKDTMSPLIAKDIASLQKAIEGR